MTHDDAIAALERAEEQIEQLEQLLPKCVPPLRELMDYYVRESGHDGSRQDCSPCKLTQSARALLAQLEQALL